MEKVVCYNCLTEISGGTYTFKNNKKIYFCSGKCLDKYEENKNEN